MRVHRWQDLEHKATPREREAARRWARDESARLDLMELSLQALRESLGKTQVELAEALEVSQSELSASERREDRLISTLRRYVEALGGELEVCALVGGKRIRLLV